MSTFKNNVKNKLADTLDDLVTEKKNNSGLGNNQIADEIGIGKGQLSKCLNAQTELGISSLVKISQYFGVSTDYLLGLSNLKSTDENYKTVHKLTGLSDKAINNINADLISGNNSIIDVLNVLLEHKYRSTYFDNMATFLYFYRNNKDIPIYSKFGINNPNHQKSSVAKCDIDEFLYGLKAEIENKDKTNSKGNKKKE